MEYLLFRPPRRQPRIMAGSTEVNKLAIITSDPWELRFIAEHSIPLDKTKRQDKCQVLLQEAIIRERPQALVVMASRSTARQIAKQFAKHYDLPLVEIGRNELKRFTQKTNETKKDSLQKYFKHMPQRHVSKELFKNKLLLKTVMLSHIALSKLLKLSYHAKPYIEPEQ